MGKNLEENLNLNLDFTKLRQIVQTGVEVIPTVAQDVITKKVLIVGYVNQKALDYTLQHGIAAFWSTSRNELWIKGKTSKNFLEIIDILVNCEQNSLLYLVKLNGTGSCHTKDKNGNFRETCFYRKINNHCLEFIDECFGNCRITNQGKNN